MRSILFSFFLFISCNQLFAASINKNTPLSQWLNNCVQHSGTEADNFLKVLASRNLSGIDLVRIVKNPIKCKNFSAALGFKPFFIKRLKRNYDYLRVKPSLKESETRKFSSIFMFLTDLEEELGGDLDSLKSKSFYELEKDSQRLLYIIWTYCLSPFDLDKLAQSPKALENFFRDELDVSFEPYYIEILIKSVENCMSIANRLNFSATSIEEVD